MRTAREARAARRAAAAAEKAQRRALRTQRAALRRASSARRKEDVTERRELTELTSSVGVTRCRKHGLLLSVPDGGKKNGEG